MLIEDTDLVLVEGSEAETKYSITQSNSSSQSISIHLCLVSRDSVPTGHRREGQITLVQLVGFVIGENPLSLGISNIL